MKDGDDEMKAKPEMSVVDINAVKSRMLVIRRQQVLLGRDVATLYGVKTKEINLNEGD